MSERTVEIDGASFSLEAERAAGFCSLFASATDRPSFAAILRGLASALGREELPLGPVTIDGRRFEPPAG